MTTRLLIALCALFLLASCKKPEPPAEQKEEVIRIGEFASLSGPQATFGLSVHNGAKLAVDEINAAGGVLGRKLELITRDTQSKAGETATIVQELISRENVDVLLGEVASQRSLEAAPIAQENGIPMISPASTNDAVTKQGDNIFRLCFVDAFQGTVMAKFAKSIQVRRAAILVDNAKSYSMGLADAFKDAFTRMGGEIVAEQSYAGGDKEFRAQLTAIKAANPEAIFLPSYYTDAPLIIKQAREIGIEVPFMGTDGWDSPDFLALGGDAVEGNYFSNHFSHESKDPKVQSFVSTYRERFGATPDAIAALGYDSVMLLADAYKRAGSTDKAALRQALAGTEGFSGVTGTITFDADRNPSKSASIIRVQDGQFSFLEIVEP